jgi:hypothetical protein
MLFSNSAYLQLVKGEKCFLVEYKSTRLSSKEIVKELKNLLSGKPIVIQQNNVLIFQNIVQPLDNNDFEVFLGKKYLNFQQLLFSEAFIFYIH